MTTANSDCRPECHIVGDPDETRPHSQYLDDSDPPPFVPSEGELAITPETLDAGAGIQTTGRKSLSDYRVNHAETLGLTWQEIENLRPPYVVDGIGRRGEVVLFGAEAKRRKSWLVQNMGFSVAAGIPWLADENGEHGLATRKARVHVIDLELSRSEMLFRCAKGRGNQFANEPKVAAEITANVFAYSLDGLNVADVLPLLEELKATVNPGDLVIIDCLYRLCPDGNEVAPLAAILETIKRFAAETQSCVILVDHFRKAGDDKARNRFAGSFIKQAAAGTLVAIEATPDDLLVLNIDARTFHGLPIVYVRFNPDTYSFNRVPEMEVSAARDGKAQADAEGWLIALWRSRPWDFRMTAADAAERWQIKRQSAAPRLRRLVSRGFLTEHINGTGKATEWTLEPVGAAIVKKALGLTV